MRFMHNMHKYVPHATYQVAYQGEDARINEDFYHTILFRVDQLTAYRSCAAQAARSNDDTAIGRLEGLTVVVEDWYASLTLMRVINACHQIPIVRYIFCGSWLQA